MINVLFLSLLGGSILAAFKLLGSKDSIIIYFEDNMAKNVLEDALIYLKMEQREMEGEISSSIPPGRKVGLICLFISISLSDISCLVFTV